MATLYPKQIDPAPLPQDDPVIQLQKIVGVIGSTDPNSLVYKVARAGGATLTSIDGGNASQD